MNERRTGTVLYIPFGRRPRVVVNVTDAGMMRENPVWAGAGYVKDVVRVLEDHDVCVKEAYRFGSLMELQSSQGVRVVHRLESAELRQGVIESPSYWLEVFWKTDRLY